jgi:coenzyme F420-0:L-glutamate ligase/coenzyme F420-1:gamma-L-glutamate ligase
VVHPHHTATKEGDVARGLEILPVEGVGEVRPGDDLAGQLAAAAPDLAAGDVLVVTQKVVSKAEAQLVPIDPNDPDSKARIVEGESVRVLRRRGELIISETRHGFVCANAGVDLSNVEDGWAALLPEDPDRSARRLRDGLRARLGVQVAVIISDTFGRVWRRGLTDVAIGCAGIRAVVDLRGTTDALGRELAVTEVCVVDELAAAAELVMGKSSGICAAVVRGVDPAWLGRGEVRSEVVRPAHEDLFR